MTVERQAFGKTGEDRAVDELERRGYAVLARRYRTKHGEIDIVARDGDTTVFVEVKARATAEFGTAAEAVTRRKQLQLASMARDYLARSESHECPVPVRRRGDRRGGGVGGDHGVSARVRCLSVASRSLPVGEGVWYSKGFGRTVGRSGAGAPCEAVPQWAGITQW